MTLRQHPAVQAAEREVRAILQNFTWATTGMARAMIRVEVTRKGEDELWRLAAEHDVVPSIFSIGPLLDGGPMLINGVSYYVVDVLPGRAIWRVIQPLDVA